MKRLFTVLFLTLTLASFSQKVKIKNGMVSIDEVETYKFEKEGNSETLSTLSGNEFITLLKDGFEEYRSGYRYYTTVYTIKFLVSGQQILSDMSDKDIIKAIYKSGMVDADGKINEEKMNIFVNKYSNENLKLKLAK